MDKQSEAWMIFEHTGKIADYLHYCNITGEKANELQNQRSRIEPEEIQQRTEVSNSSQPGTWTH